VPPGYPTARGTPLQRYVSVDGNCLEITLSCPVPSARLTIERVEWLGSLDAAPSVDPYLLIWLICSAAAFIAAPTSSSPSRTAL
jgi:hypothetical protein